VVASSTLVMAGVGALAGLATAALLGGAQPNYNKGAKIGGAVGAATVLVPVLLRL